MISRLIGKGNKSSAFIQSIQSDLLSHVISLDNVRGDETLQQVENILEFVDSFIESYSKLSSKDVKLLSSVTSLLCNEFGRNPSNTSSPAVVKACKLKAVASVYRLLRIPFIIKNLENCIIGLCNCIDPSDAHLSLLALNCICLGLVSDNEDAYKYSICLQLERLGFYERLLGIFDRIVINNLQKKNENELCLLHVVLISTDHLVWLLGETMSSSSASSSDFKSFQTRIVGQILKHHGVIFELTIHDESAMRFATTILLVQMLHSQERKFCCILQETARNYGLMLWTLKRLAELSLEVITQNITSSSSLIQIAGEDSPKAASPQDDSIECCDLSLIWRVDIEGLIFDISEAQMTSTEIDLDSVRLLLTLLCLGDKINQAVVFRALPESFVTFLSFQVSHGIDISTSDMDTDRRGSISKAVNSVTGIRRLFRGQSKNDISSSVHKKEADSLTPSIHSNGNSDSNTIQIDNCGGYAAILTSNGGVKVRVAFAAKMGASRKGSWHILFSVLCEDFENPCMVWSSATLTCLTEGLQGACNDLERQRAVSYEHWDTRNLDVVYPVYDSIDCLCVRGMFLPQLIEELLSVGRTSFLDDPHGSLWAILDRANIEVGMVTRAVVNSDKNDGQAAKKMLSMDKLLICLKAIHLLLARYHPELHNVTPIYTLCDILRKGVSAMSFGLMDLKNLHSNTDDVRKDSEQDNVFSWINLILEILQLRLSGPISRGDWGDFVSAGGADSLCIILTSSIESYNNATFAVGSNSEKKSKAISVVQQETISSDKVSEKEEDIEHLKYFQQKKEQTLELAAQLLQNFVFSSCSQYGRVFASPGGLDQISRAIWLIFKRFNCVDAQSNSRCIDPIDKHKKISTNMAVDNLEENIERQSEASLEAEEQLIDGEVEGNEGLKGSSSIPRSLSLALSALVAVAKKVIEWTRSRTDGEEGMKAVSRESPSNMLLLLTDRRMLLMRALLSSSIQVKYIDNNFTSVGALTISTAKLFKELLLILKSSERIYVNKSEGIDHTTETTEATMVTAKSQDMENILSRLPFLLPERMRYLCRHLSSSSFCAVFNSEVEIISPEIVWSPVLRLKCLTNINEDLADWSQQISMTNCHYPPSVLIPSDSSQLYAVPLRDCQSLLPSPFPSLDVECQVMGVYLQLFLYCRRDSFLVPLDAQAFGYALSKHLLHRLLSDDKYGCLYQLCLSHLIQVWPKELPTVLFSNHVVPMLLTNLANCAAELKERSHLHPLPLCTEVLESSTSSIIALSSYLKGSPSFISTALSSIEGLNKTDGSGSNHNDNISANSDNYDEGYNRPPLTPVGFGCSRLIKASSGVLSSMIFSCLSHISTACSSLEECSPSQDNLFGKAVILNLNTTLALIATMALMLAEAAHIERVRYKQLLSEKHDGKTSFDNDTMRSLDIVRKALRVDNNSLLAGLVSCCSIKVALVAPQTTLSAISTLHLLIGIESSDDIEPCSSIFNSIDSEDNPCNLLQSLGDILLGMGLPSILLNTATLSSTRQNITPLHISSILASVEDSIPQYDIVAPIETDCLATNRWATHPLFTTDRFMHSISPPVEFLPSPNTGNNSRQQDHSNTTPQSLNSILQQQLEEAEESLKSDFVSSFVKLSSNTVNSDIDTTCSKSSVLGTAIAWECIELIRLLSIAPNAFAPSASKTTSASPQKEQTVIKDTINLTFPANITEVSIGILNRPLSRLLEQMLTAPMVHLMMTNESLFLSILNTEVLVKRPLVIWCPDMRKNMLKILKVDDNVSIDKLMIQFMYPDGRPEVNLEKSGERSSNSLSTLSTDNSIKENIIQGISSESDGIKKGDDSEYGISTLDLEALRKGLHSNLAVECIVDHVYVRFLSPQPPLGPPLGDQRDQDINSHAFEESWKAEWKDDIGSRDLSQFIRSLQTSINSNRLVINHIMKTSGGSTVSLRDSGNSATTARLNMLRAQLSLKERVFTWMLADHDELGYAYSDLYLAAD